MHEKHAWQICHELASKINVELAPCDCPNCHSENRYCAFNIKAIPICNTIYNQDIDRNKEMVIHMVS